VSEYVYTAILHHAKFLRNPSGVRLNFYYIVVLPTFAPLRGARPAVLYTAFVTCSKNRHQRVYLDVSQRQLRFLG